MLLYFLDNMSLQHSEECAAAAHTNTRRPLGEHYLSADDRLLSSTRRCSQDTHCSVSLLTRWFPKYSRWQIFRIHLCWWKCVGFFFKKHSEVKQDQHWEVLRKQVTHTAEARLWPPFTGSKSGTKITSKLNVQRALRTKYDDHRGATKLKEAQINPSQDYEWAAYL